MRREAGDFLIELGNALLELGLLAGAGDAAQLEQAAFAVHDARDLGVAQAAGQESGEAQLLGAVALGFEPGLARRQLVERLDDHGEIGARRGVVEPHQKIARAHPVAVPGAQLGHHAAGRVLDLLDVGFDHHQARGDDGAGNLGRYRPAADAEADQQHDGDAGDQVIADGAARWAWGCRIHDFTSPTAFGAAGTATGRAILRSTSSLGPNA